MSMKSDRDDQDEKDVSLLAFHQYMRLVRSTPPLADGEEVCLLEQIEQGRREQQQSCPNVQMLAQAVAARGRLVAVYQPLVIHIARKYETCFRSMDLLDLIQEGNLGLLKAIDRHDGSKGYPLVALVGRLVEGAILTALYRRDGLVRIDDAILQQLKQLRLAEGRLVARHGRDPHVQELAAEMGIAVGNVVALLEVVAHRRIASLQHIVDEERDEDEYQFVSLFAQAVAQENERQKELERAVQWAVETVLTSRQQEVVRLRYGLEADDQRALSQSEVAMRLGGLRENVRNIEQGAKKRLANALRPVKQLGQYRYEVRETRHDDYYTAKEAMQRLHMSSTHFYRHVYRGTIAGQRGEGRKNVWLFPKAVIDALAGHDGLEDVS